MKPSQDTTRRKSHEELAEEALTLIAQGKMPTEEEYERAFAETLAELRAKGLPREKPPEK